MAAPRRDWSDARAKVEREGCCRVCGRRSGELVNGDRVRIEAAHVSGRMHDRPWPVLDDLKALIGNTHPPMAKGSAKLYVDPLDIVPLCGPPTSTGTCHAKFDHHRLYLLPYLSIDEQVVATYRAGSIAGALRALGGDGPAMSPPTRDLIGF